MRGADHLDVARPVSSDARFLRAARQGRLESLGHEADRWLEQQRERLLDGALDAAAITDLDSAAPDWGSCSPREIDYAWHEAANLEWPSTRPLPSARFFLDPLSKAYVDALASGQLAATPRAYDWLSARRIEHASGAMSQSLVTILGDAHPFWFRGTASDLDAATLSPPTLNTKRILSKPTRGSRRDSDAVYDALIGAARADLLQGLLGPQDLAALDAGVPGWRPEGPVWVGPLAPPTPEVPAAETRVTALPARRGFTPLGDRCLQLAHHGELGSLGSKAVGWLKRMRVGADHGLLSSEQLVALDRAAPGWRHLLPHQLDAARMRARDSAVAEFTQMVRAGRLHASYAASVFISVQRADDREGRLSADHAKVLDREFPGWRSSTLLGIDEAVEARTAAARRARLSRNPRSVESFERHLTAARDARLSTLTTAEGWLHSMRRREQADQLPEPSRQALDATIPTWRTDSPRTLDSLVAGLPTAADARHIERVRQSWPKPHALQRSWLEGCRRDLAADSLSPAVIAKLDEYAPGWRDGVERHSARSANIDHLPLARLGRLMEHEQASYSWLSRQRRRDRKGTLPEALRRAMDEAAPAWRTDSPRQLDASRAVRADVAVPRTFGHFIARAQEGRLDDSGVRQAVAWLERMRSMERSGRLSAPRRQAMYRALPGWRAGSAHDVVDFYSRGPLPGATIAPPDRAFLLLLRGTWTDPVAQAWLQEARHLERLGRLPQAIRHHLDLINPQWAAA